MIRLLILCVLLPGFAQARIIDRVVAVVNDEIIADSELADFMAPFAAKLADIPDPVARAQAEDKQRRRLLDELVGQRLVLQEATRRKLTVTVEEVDAHISRILSQQSWDQKQLDGYLLTQGLSRAEFRKQVREQLVRQRVVRSTVGARIRLTERELQDYYKEKVTESKARYELEAAHILVAVPAEAAADEEAAARRQAQEILKRAQAGEDFAALAKQYSTGPGADAGGTLGTVRKGDLDPVLEDALFSIEEGAVGGPVRTRFGYHVVRAVRRKVLPPPDFKAIEANLRRELTDRRMSDELSRWIEELKKKAFIEIRL